MRQPYNIYLYPKANQGCGCRYDKRRGFKRWFVSYQTTRKDGSSPRREIEWLDVETREEAREARDRRYTELLLAGAKWKGQEPKKLIKPKKKEIHPDDCLHKQYTKQIWWKVVVEGKYLGGSRSKVEARRIRDNYLKNKREAELLPCPECGGTPVFSKNHRTLKHEGDCPLAFEMPIRDLGKFTKITLWNKHIRRGKFKGEKKIYLSHVEPLL